MAIEDDFIRQSDAPVIVAGSTGSVAATVGLMEAALARPQSALVLYGLDDAETAVEAHPEHPQHGLHQLLARFDICGEDVLSLSAHGPGRDKGWGPDAERRAQFIGEAMRPAPATAEWAPYIESLRREEGEPGARPVAYRSRDHSGRNGGDCADFAREPRNGRPDRSSGHAQRKHLDRVRHALAKWGFEGVPGECGGQDGLAARSYLAPRAQAR